MCPACRAPIPLPFAQRTLEVTRACAQCNRSWRITATPVSRFGIGQVTQVSFQPEV